jgi:hypothetical protein
MIILLISTTLYASDTFLYMSYNVEQLYDNIDDPSSADDRFLKTSSPSYTDDVIRQKISNIADVILSTSDNSFYQQGPDVVSLLEVENLNILEMLADELNSRLTGKEKYKAIFIPGDDPSGINPGLLSKFPIVETIAHKVHKEDRTWYMPGYSIASGSPKYTVTRSILETTVSINNRLVTFYSNHWPAKPESLKVLRRYACGSHLNKLIAAKLSANPDQEIIVSGDFNTQPEDASLQAGLQSDHVLSRVIDSPNSSPYLYGTSYDIFNKSGVKAIFYHLVDQFMENHDKTGTWDETTFDKLKEYYSEPDWARICIAKFISANKSSFDYRSFSNLKRQLLDNIMRKRGTFFYWPKKEWTNLDSIHITKNLFDSKGIEYIKNSYSIIKHDFMTFSHGKPLAFHKCKRDPKGGPCLKNPDGSIILQGGYSDHFPVTASFTIN